MAAIPPRLTPAILEADVGVTDWVYAAASQTVWGENVHPMRALNIGLNLHFSIWRGATPGPRAGLIHQSR